MDGILVIDKPAGMTSHDVVARIRRWTGERRIGHTGTLDPDVTGVLVLCLGRATRLAEYLSGEDKEYIGTMAFGTATDTQDASGRVIARIENPQVEAQALRRAAEAMTGWIRQRPPSFSAVRIGGKRAYDLARAGQLVELPARTVHVARFEVGDPCPRNGLVEVSFRVACSKGTYVRTLCHDLGQAMGIPAHMVSLRRIRQGPFTLEDALPWAEAEAAGAEGDLPRWVKPMAWAVRNWPRLDLTEEEAAAVRHGKCFLPEDGRIVGGSAHLPQTIAALYRGELAAVCRAEGRRVRPVKVFLE
ncbi:MAG: tRNA pseudouridine(55) synthase TruB [Alicyclobacillaceae bacterium]|nr:tRNA pseudouridine(55) synthase TruB [Alicyclobacillaceae bacterium]